MSDPTPSIARALDQLEQAFDEEGEQQVAQEVANLSLQFAKPEVIAEGQSRVQMAAGGPDWLNFLSALFDVLVQEFVTQSSCKGAQRSSAVTATFALVTVRGPSALILLE